MNLSKELEVAKEAAVRAGTDIMEVYGRYLNDSQIIITSKHDNSPLTEADSRANDIITATLSAAFPRYSILSEESRDDLSRLQNDYCWIVDPLDGTKEFIGKNGEFTVNIALSYKHRAVLGVIYVPVTAELYYAAKGSGAYIESDGKTRAIRSSDKTDDIRMVMSRSHASDKLSELIRKYNITNTKSAGSSLKGCLVAKGDADVYYRFGKTMEWDTAAMQCIAEEAGAIFRQSDDSEMLYNRENSLNEKGFYIINRAENRMVL